MNVGDVVRLERGSGSPGAWKVTSVILGAEGQESVYGLTCIDYAHPYDEFGLRITTMYVPTIFIDRLAS